jgi:hypothetical protein
LRATVAAFLYLSSSLGANYLWSRVPHFRHLEASPSPIVSGLIVGVAIPLILGFACAALLKPKGTTQYWPMVVAPLAALVLRLLLDDVSAGWLAGSALQLAIAALLSAACAVMGAWLAVQVVTHQDSV